MKKVIVLISTIILLSSVAFASTYTNTQCEGSSIPYPTPPENSLTYPDSLTPIFINHVGRHGARFMSSSKFTKALKKSLVNAEKLGCITPEGLAFKKQCQTVIAKTNDNWGALDSLGRAEQREIATRAFNTFKTLFAGRKIHAISSYVPRCVASMDEFTHQLTRLDTQIEIYTSSGKQNSPLVRPWESDTAYQKFMKSDKWSKIYDSYRDSNVPESVSYRILGSYYPFTGDEARNFALNVYKLVSGCAAIDIECDWDKYMTIEEYNSLWSIENMHHYLTHSASSISDIPAELASRLLLDLISTTQEAVNGKNEYSARFRFGHAETLMPLLSLMHIKDCYYLTHDFNTVKLHWRDFYVVPMAANLQIILFKSVSGKYYIRVDHNEVPVPLLPDDESIYIPWDKAKGFLLGCVKMRKYPV